LCSFAEAATLTAMNFCRLALGLLIFSAIPNATHAGLSISNFESRATVRYPVVLLRGKGIPQQSGKDATAIEVENLSAHSDRSTRKLLGQARDGKFKALAELVPGRNELRLKAAGESLHFILNYEPQTNPHYVRVVWMTDKDGDTDFAAPDDSVTQDYAARLDTAAKLMQCFTAERMHESGLGRRTFRLELDDEGKVVVHKFAAPKSAADYYAMEDSPWWGEVNRWINRQHGDPMAKNMVLAAFTRKDPESGKMLGHTALGGGNLGLFGSASVFSWPRSLNEVGSAFLDARKVDPTKVHDDSAGRHTWLGCASTTMGATLHEMGHTFGLPHCTDRFGIMTRGFDYLNRFFTLYEPPSGRRLKPFEFEPEDEAKFADVSSSYLRWSRWFTLDDSPSTSDPPDATPRISFDEKTKRFTIESASPVRWLGFWPDDRVAAHRDIPQGVEQKKISLSLAECEAELGPGHTLSRLSVMAENGLGVTLRFVETRKRE
jgi:hypothetical protein